MVKYCQIFMLSILSWISFCSLTIKAQNNPVSVKPVKLTFDVYNKNLHVIVIKASYLLSSDRYAIQARFNSAGIVSFFVDLDMTLRGQGKIQGNNLFPDDYQSFGKSKGKKFIANIDFSHPQNVKIITLDPPKEEKRDALSQDQMNGSIDLVSAMMELVHRVRTHQNCDDQFKILDGTRIFMFQSQTAGKMQIPSSWTSPYKGEALFCKAVAQQTGGLKRSRHRALSAQPQPGSLWFKEIDNIGMLPVRFEFHNPKMGEVIVILRRVSNE